MQFNSQSIPLAYRFGFTPSVKHKSESGETWENVFQFSIHKNFKEFLEHDKASFSNENGTVFAPGALQEIMHALNTVKKHPKLQFEYSYFDDYKHEYVYNLAIPKPTESDFSGYLLDEVIFLQWLFRYLAMSVRRYAETESAKQQCRLSVWRQPYEVVLSVNGVSPMLMVAMSNNAINGYAQFKSLNQNPVEKIENTIKSILKPLDTIGQKRPISERISVNFDTDADYVNFQIWGEGTHMYLNSGDLCMTARHTDFPFQALALLAGCSRPFQE